MIILSQDKTEIINFDNIMNISISDCEKEGFLVAAGFIVGRDDNYRDLGYYKTEERAKEVLQEIIKKYDLGMCRLGKTFMSLEKYEFIYEMPEE